MLAVLAVAAVKQTHLIQLTAAAVNAPTAATAEGVAVVALAAA
jgi:hypothetical protein